MRPSDGVSALCSLNLPAAQADSKSSDFGRAPVPVSAELKVLCNLGLRMETLNLAVGASPTEAKALLISFPPFAFVQPGRGLKPLTFGT